MMMQQQQQQAMVMAQGAAMAQQVHSHTTAQFRRKFFGARNSARNSLTSPLTLRAGDGRAVADGAGLANTMQMYGASAAEDQIGRGHGPLGHAQRLPPGQRGRNGRDENRSQYVINLGRVRAAEDGRTTLMVKNIPNKYTQRMLLETCLLYTSPSPRDRG